MTGYDLLSSRTSFYSDAGHRPSYDAEGNSHAVRLVGERQKWVVLWDTFHRGLLFDLAAPRQLIRQHEQLLPSAGQLQHSPFRPGESTTSLGYQVAGDGAKAGIACVAGQYRRESGKHRVNAAGEDSPE